MNEPELVNHSDLVFQGVTSAVYVLERITAFVEGEKKFKNLMNRQQFLEVLRESNPKKLIEKMEEVIRIFMILYGPLLVQEKILGNGP